MKSMRRESPDPQAKLCGSLIEYIDKHAWIVGTGEDQSMMTCDHVRMTAMASTSETTDLLFRNGFHEELSQERMSRRAKTDREAACS